MLALCQMVTDFAAPTQNSDSHQTESMILSYKMVIYFF
jgi:hypothetical protein